MAHRREKLGNFWKANRELLTSEFYIERVVDPLPLMTYGLKLSLKA